MMDRRRDKVRGSLDWTASEKLSLQVSLESAQDNYSAPTTTGLHDGSMFAAAVDGSYAVTDTWKATGYFNYSEQVVNQNHSAGYIARILNTTASVGVGMVGKVSSKLEMGGDISYLNDLTGYGLNSGSTAPAGSLPDVTYRVLALKVFGKYALDAQSDIRVDLVHQNIGYDEWTWSSSGVPFAYSDNSTVAMQQNQNVTYLGVKYVYRIK
jgi:hypothetical protein